MESGEAAAQSDFEDCAVASAAARRGEAIQISVRTDGQFCNRRGSHSSAIKRKQKRNGSCRTDSKYGPKRVSPAPWQDAVKISITGQRQPGSRIVAIDPV